MTFPRQIEARCVPEEARRVREWAAAQFADPAAQDRARQLAAELFVTMHLVTRLKVVLVISAPVRGYVRMSIHGPRYMPLYTRIGHSWTVIHALAAQASLTDDQSGIWAEIPTGAPMHA